MSTVDFRAPRPGRVKRGILFMCAAVVLFAFMNAFVKLLSSTYEPVQLVWARTLAHFIFILLIFMPRSGFAVMRTARPGTQFMRSVIQVCSTACFFTALRFIPLAEAISISFLAPLIVTLLATRMLGERISVPRLIAILVGLCGVLIVIRPGSDVFHWASLLILGSAFFYANYQILTRRVASVDKPETSAFYSAVVGSVVTSLAVPFFWRTPDSVFDIALLASLGVLGGTGHYLVARALFNAPANIASPFQYLSIGSRRDTGLLDIRGCAVVLYVDRLGDHRRKRALHRVERVEEGRIGKCHGIRMSMSRSTNMSSISSCNKTPTSRSPPG